MGKKLQGNYNIPQPRPISNNGIPITFSFIGDEGFALSQHWQRPYAGKHLPRNKRIYNYRLTPFTHYAAAAAFFAAAVP